MAGECVPPPRVLLYTNGQTQQRRGWAHAAATGGNKGRGVFPLGRVTLTHWLWPTDGATAPATSPRGGGGWVAAGVHCTGLTSSGTATHTPCHPRWRQRSNPPVPLVAASAARNNQRRQRLRPPVTLETPPRHPMPSQSGALRSPERPRRAPPRITRSSSSSQAALQAGACRVARAGVVAAGPAAAAGPRQEPRQVPQPSPGARAPKTA